MFFQRSFRLSCHWPQDKYWTRDVIQRGLWHLPHFFIFYYWITLEFGATNCDCFYWECDTITWCLLSMIVELSFLVLTSVAALWIFFTIISTDLEESKQYRSKYFWKIVFFFSFIPHQAISAYSYEYILRCGCKNSWPLLITGLRHAKKDDTPWYP